MVTSFLLACLSAANAGGVGLVAHGGLHADRAYYYDAEQRQGIDTQLRPNTGIGFDGVLGSKSDRVVGLWRMTLLVDSPVNNPTVPADVEDPTHPDYESLDPRLVGTASVGLQWGILGDPQGTQLAIHSLVGAGFLTRDSTEFILAEVGPAVVHNLSPELQVWGSVDATYRFRKLGQLGANAYAGVRVLFD